MREKCRLKDEYLLYPGPSSQTTKQGHQLDTTSVQRAAMQDDHLTACVTFQAATVEADGIQKANECYKPWREGRQQKQLCLLRQAQLRNVVVPALVPVEDGQASDNS